MNNEAPNFFDRRTIGAIVLVFVTWMGWQYYMQQKYPQMFQKKAQPEATTPAVNPASEAPVATSPAGVEKAGNDVIQPVDHAETFSDFTANNFSFQISSNGMGIKNLKLIKYTNRKGETVEFSPGHLPLAYETRLLGTTAALPFAVQKMSEHVWVGQAKLGDMTITKTIEVDPDKYAFDVKILAEGQDAKFIGLSTLLSDEIEPQKAASFLNRSQFERQEAFVDGAESHNNHIYFATDLIDKNWTNGRVAALGSQYFTQAFLDRSPVMPEFKLHVDPSAHVANLLIQYSRNNNSGVFAVHYTAFVGPKSLSLLKSVDEDFGPVVDLGFFSFIGRYILDMLKGFYSLVGNWGIAIILLTIVVRLLVLPFNIISYRSMKTMQALQPQLQSIKERFKDDQQRANQETMALFRTHKVNPAGGCLPILLQFPIFWALYQVLGHSIELYQADFGLWIHDLSLKDPYYVLPVLMGITMFTQQLLTPTPTMDPNQARIMKFVPLIFAFFMISLPSGLTLYIWISALFAVVQQTYFMKSHNRLVEAI